MNNMLNFDMKIIFLLEVSIKNDEVMRRLIEKNIFDMITQIL